ncbi:MAG: replication protein [Bacteroidetes bacterium]|nr:replication protein [Bacteroidota bacterium]
MNYQQTTQVPNIVFDKLIAQLKLSEAIVLLIVIRQTYGWYDQKTGKRKVRDWISNGQFQKKTGLSRKTISRALQYLIKHNYIRATDAHGVVLSTTKLRRGKVRIFYQPLFACGATIVKRCEKKVVSNGKKVRITKLTTKLTQASIKRLSDRERYQEIQLQLNRKI